MTEQIIKSKVEAGDELRMSTEKLLKLTGFDVSAENKELVEAEIIEALSEYFALPAAQRSAFVETVVRPKISRALQA